MSNVDPMESAPLLVRVGARLPALLTWFVRTNVRTMLTALAVYAILIASARWTFQRGEAAGGYDDLRDEQVTHAFAVVTAVILIASLGVLIRHRVQSRRIGGPIPVRIGRYGILLWAASAAAVKVAAFAVVVTSWFALLAIITVGLIQSGAYRVPAPMVFLAAIGVIFPVAALQLRWFKIEGDTLAEGTSDV